MLVPILPMKMNIMERWDWLIILDACRYDFFEKNWSRGVLEARLSYGSCTVEFLNNIPPIPDSILITGHPFPLKRKDKFTKIIDVGFDYNLSTSPPQYITRYVLNHFFYLKKYRRKVLWYLQPHHPYIGKTRLDVPIYAEKRPSGFTAERETIARLKWAKKHGILEQAYEDNLKLALSEIKKILPLMKGRVIITADHGEGLGIPLRLQDRPVFSHPCGRKEWEVRLVPWCIIDNF